MTRKERAVYLNQLIIPDLFDNSQEACELRINQETALRETIEELMQEPCKGAISREDTLKLIYDYKEKHTEDRKKYPINYSTLLDLIRLIRGLPSVTPAEKVGQ